MTMCENFKREMVQLLEERIRRILSAAESGGDEHMVRAQAHCFHLMELQRILEGKPTCGVFDNYGSRSATTEAHP